MSNHPIHAELAALAAVLLLSACPPRPDGPVQSEEPTPVATEVDGEATPVESAPEPEPVVAESGKAILHTSVGDITITFFPELAPQTVKHVVELMAAGCYDGVEIFRLEPDFVAQVGGVENADCHPDAMATVPDEPTNVLKHQRLHLSLARDAEPNSGTSSFSMMLGNGPHLDGQFALFGKIVAGAEVLEKLEAIGSTPGEQGMRFLNEKVTIDRVEVIEPVVPAPTPTGQ